MKKEILKNTRNNFIIWLTGGIIYFFFEIMVRGYSHISMFFCGGICFLVVGIVGNKILDKKRKLISSLLYVMITGSLIITLFEFVTGVYVNLYLKLNVWDYSGLKFNLFGQVCLLYSALWALLSLPCVFFSGLINRFILDGGD